MSESICVGAGHIEIDGKHCTLGRGESSALIRSATVESFVMSLSH